MSNLREVISLKYFTLIAVLFILLAVFGWWVENGMEKHHGPDATQPVSIVRAWG